MSAANRGKDAEKKIKAWLEAKKATTNLAYHRLPDTHAGSRVATLSDFLVAVDGKTSLLEVKEVDHEYRLPYGNFEVENVSRLKMWRLAGVSTPVAVYFKPIKKWRFTWSDYFENRPLVTVTGRPMGSWNMSGLDLHPIDELNHWL